MSKSLDFETQLNSVIAQPFCASLITRPNAVASKKENFTASLEASIQRLLYDPFLDLSCEIIKVLNELGHELELEKKDDTDELCFMYSRPIKGGNQIDSHEVLVAFDIHVSVFFTEDNTIESSIEDNFPEDKIISNVRDNRFSRYSFEQIGSAEFEDRSVELQGLVELEMCEGIRSHFQAITDRLNLLGHNLKNLNSAKPEIDYYDRSTNLHIGIYCIATVDIKFTNTN